MSKAKKTTAIILAMVLTLTLTACGNSDGNYFKKLIELYNSGGYEAVLAEMRTDRFEKEFLGLGSISVYALNGETGCGFYYPDGRGKCVYIGEYSDGLRSGQGVLIVDWYVGDDLYRLYTGSWADDKPNGEGVYELHGIEGNAEDYIILTGTFKDGLCHGSINMKEKFSYLEYEHVPNFNFTVNNGIPQITDPPYGVAECTHCAGLDVRHGLNWSDDTIMFDGQNLYGIYGWA